jgi:CopG family transcriptional regulator/antitoxin EndoAI
VADYKRIMISVPANLLQEFDGLALEAGSNRSEMVREALRRFIEERKKRTLRERLKQGYLEMASLNLQLAEEGFEPDELSPRGYESYLAECEGKS